MYKEYINEMLANSAYCRLSPRERSKEVTVKDECILEGGERWMYCEENVLLCHISYMTATVKMYKPMVINNRMSK